MTLFGLAESYDNFVRPYVSIVPAKSELPSGQGEDKGQANATINGAQHGANTPGASVVTPTIKLIANGAAAGATNPQDDSTSAQGKATERAKIMKKHYSHMIADVPGTAQLHSWTYTHVKFATTETCLPHRY